MEIEQYLWGFTDEGEAVVRYVMRNAAGSEVHLTNLGAAVTAVRVPDRRGRIGDVVHGYGSLDDYLREEARMGQIVGRYAGCIARGRFSLDGREYRLGINLPPHHVHGGVRGLGRVLWESRVETNRVVFTTERPAGEEGYPGTLLVEAIYDWDDEHALEITLRASTDAPTIVNLTSFLYFNLEGTDNRPVGDHRLTVAASRYAETDDRFVPTGTLLPCTGTPLDFGSGRALGDGLCPGFPPTEVADGYDHTLLLDGWEPGILRCAGRLEAPATGRRMEILTSQPALHLYTANRLAGNPPLPDGTARRDHTAVVLACQAPPDAPNHADFPSTVLRPGERYVAKTVYRFATD